MKRNKILFGLAALVVAFGLVFSVSAFKASKPKTFVPQWYNLSATGSTTNMQIISTETSNKPDDPDCNDSNTGDRCAVQLDFAGAVPPIGDLAGESVAQILLDYPGSSVIDETKRP